jgi:hypothetical protein
MSENKTNELAKKVARLMQAETQDADLYSLQSSIENINNRLANIEAKLETQNSIGFGHPSKIHPSQDKFQIDEAVAHEITECFETEKACPYEPTGKPCDHCAMCNSRGF